MTFLENDDCVYFHWNANTVGYGDVDQILAPVGFDEMDTYPDIVDAIDHAFQDDFGVRQAEYGTFLEIVAVPDDVAQALPTADGLVVLVGELRVSAVKQELGV